MCSSVNTPTLSKTFKTTRLNLTHKTISADLRNLTLLLIRFVIGDLAGEVVQSICQCCISSRLISEIVAIT